MRRWVPWQDIVFFGGVPFGITALAVLAALTPQDWSLGKVVTIGVTVFLAWLGFVLFLWRKIQTKPDFITPNGVMVWTNGLPVTSAMVDQATSFYWQYLSRRSGPYKDTDEIAQALAMLRVEFTPKQFTSIFYPDRKLSGIQNGGYLKVAWFGGFHQNAYFHELHHLTERILFARVDYKHEGAWWELIPEMKAAWAALRSS